MSRRQLTLLLLLSNTLGCSTFMSDWEALGPHPETYETIEGRWEGSWSCQKTGHEGELWCIVEQETESTYRMRYRAVWGGIFTSEYTIDMTVTPEGTESETLILRGEEDLGFWFGGLCTYSGLAIPTDFVAFYRSEDNEGEFTMARPRHTDSPQE